MSDDTDNIWWGILILFFISLIPLFYFMHLWEKEAHNQWVNYQNYHHCQRKGYEYNYGFYNGGTRYRFVCDNNIIIWRKNN